MAHLNRRQRIAAGVTALVLVGSGTAAFAYWTSTGQGTGSGSTTAGASNLSIAGDVSTALYPGQAAQNFTATVTNNADNNAQVAGLTAYVTTDKTGCDGSDYSINGSSAASPVALNWTAVDLAKGASQDSVNTIQFNNKANSNQDACKGATLTLHYASN